MSQSDWFAVQRLQEQTYLIGEPMHVNSYLILGSERAVLFDTGMGIENIRVAAETITDLPILVVNSHYHFDHAGGNHLFEDIAIHEAGAAALEQGPPPEWFPRYIDFATELLEKYLEFRAIDADWFQVLGTEMQMRPLPEDLARRGWRTLPTVPTQLLRDGDTLNLGDRTLTVMHTPGHTRDCICLIDNDRRLLFTGDTVDSGPIYVHFDDSDIDAFSTSVARLAAEVVPNVDRVFSAHGARYQWYPETITEIARAAELILGGEAPFREAIDCFGDKAHEAFFGDFSITVPWGYSPQAPK
ncbi:MAG: MBL fold metallo-hydrolase [Aestuariivirga sp.]|uniref:MBL fold metallo-hydrolase n=1 Tax=Aestuariivirga sp. TaxID=2650926 RepID=UPI003018224A